MVHHDPEPRVAGQLRGVFVDDGIEVSQNVKPEHLRPGGAVSGPTPTPMALADVAFYVLLLSRTGSLPLAVTTSLNINFLRKAEPDTDLGAVSRMLKLGKRLAVGAVTIFSGASAPPAAQATLAYSLPQSRYISMD